jgi:glycine/D-amino acid oxidase-like deaminating enzyme
VRPAGDFWDADPETGQRAAEALAGASRVPLWLDTPDRPAARPALDGEITADLVIVGGGLSGLWGAVLAAEADPGRRVVLLEGARLGWAASGRNGGFCSSSLTHGLGNGLRRWPDELPQLLALGAANLDAICETVERLGIDCHLQRSGELTVALTAGQLADLTEVHAEGRRLGEPLELLDAVATRAIACSPLYLGGLLDPGGTAMLDPARLVWGLADAAERLGVRIHEDTRVRGLRDSADAVRVQTATGTVRARRVLLATSAFRSPLARLRPFVIPVWDHVLATEPLTDAQRRALGWDRGEGLSDAGNLFHYYRITPDGRLLWGGYDAVYYFGSDLRDARSRRPATERALAAHLVQTFPQLDGVRFSHAWAGAIDTCSRFTAFWHRALSGKLVSVQGYTGLGVGASRFGAQVCLDLLDGRSTERTELSIVARPPVPFPPEPLRWGAITITRGALKRADARDGRRGPWLQLLDRVGLGFDS